MATENKANPNPNTTKNKKRKQRYLPHNKPVKKGGYPLHPGVQGFFITCDGGRERQASREALNVIDSFFEELVHGKDSGVKLSMLPNKPMNKKIKFSYSDSGSDDDDGDIDDEEDKSDLHREKDANDENPSNEKSHPQKNDDVCRENQNKEKADDKTQDGNENQENDADGEKADKNTEDGNENQEVDAEEPSAKKQCLETDASTHIIHEKTEEKSIDKLIEAELQELGDRNKFAVLYEARSNTGIDRMKIINSVAKSVPGPHKVDLSNPDMTIVVQIVKTVCLIGFLEKYKELAKYNLRQLTSPK